MRISSRSKASILLTLVALATIVGGFMIAGVVRGGFANASGTTAQTGSSGNPYIRQITSSGTLSFTATAPGTDGLQLPELLTASGLNTHIATHSSNGPVSVNRSLSHGHSQGTHVSGIQTHHATHGSLLKSFDGINQRQQRLTNGGNQFSVEPPDQGLCVGNGFVMETVNDALAVYDTSGNSLLAVTALNAFYGYQPAINRSTSVYGPFVTDPSCYFDKPTQRWFHVVLTLDVNSANGAFTGTNHLDLAVSRTADPTKSWTIYRIPVQDDGSQNTPNHHCSFGPCLGDYPHIGADANGFYITTNEYSFFGSEFIAAQIYAISKASLAAGAATITVTQIDTNGLVGPAHNPGFTVWPATTPGNDYAEQVYGTEYFMTSDAAAEANGNGTSSDLIVWALTNTKSLKKATPTLTLSNTILTVGQYSIPPLSHQKVGDFPLGQCLNDSACSTFLLGQPDPFAPEVETSLDSNDTRMQQVVFAHGRLWGALDTALLVNSNNQAGIEWFVVQPQSTRNGVRARVTNQGYLGAADTNLTYPAIAVTEQGQGVMAFTLVGTNDYPSAAYTTINEQHGTGNIFIAAAGLGPDDGFSGYKAFGNPPGTTRPRWGDYGAAVADGNTIWIASEYIGQTCTLAQYEAGFVPTQFGSCGGTRTALANWYTRISNVKP